MTGCNFKSHLNSTQVLSKVNRYPVKSGDRCSSVRNSTQIFIKHDSINPKENSVFSGLFSGLDSEVIPLARPRRKTRGNAFLGAIAIEDRSGVVEIAVGFGEVAVTLRAA